MITELVRERADGPVPAPGERPAARALGVMAPGPDRCPDGCCRPQRPAHGGGRPGGDA
jgi:hypothetical protein